MNWIAVSKIGKYAQGNVTAKTLQEIVDSYDPNFMAAPFISEHRKFNDKGEMQNNLSALAWTSAIMTDGTFLYVQTETETESRLDWYFDGTSFRYASIEIEVIKKDDNSPEELYLAAVAVTNFPAAKIPQIVPQKFNRKTKGSVLYSGYNKIEIKNQNKKLETKMNKEQLIALNRILGLTEDSPVETALTKLTELKTHLSKNSENKVHVENIEKIIKLFGENKKPVAAATTENDSDLAATVKQLSESVNSLKIKLDQTDQSELEAAVNKAVTDQKILPSQKDDLIKAYAGNIEGFKSFIEKQPVLNLNTELKVPKNSEGNPVTYNDLLQDTKLYLDTKKNNLQLFNQLRAEWQKNPKQEKK